jgi:hypothetical protein
MSLAQQTRLAQQTQMIRNARLRQAQRACELTHRQLATLEQQ